MAFSKLVTELRASRVQLQKDLKAAEADLRAFHRLAAQLGTVNLGTLGGPRTGGIAPGGRLPTTLSGGRSVSQQVREEVRDRLAGFAQIRKFRKELSDQEDRELRARGAKNRQSAQTEFREQQARRQAELKALRTDIQTRAREEIRAAQERAREEARTTQQRSRQSAQGNQREAREREQRRQAELRALRSDIQSRAREEARIEQQRAQQMAQGSTRETRERERRRQSELRALRSDIQSRAQEEARLDQVRRRAEARRQRETQQAAREAASAEGFLTVGARQGVTNAAFLRRQAEQQRRAEERAARETAQVLGLGTREQTARSRQIAERERQRQLRSASLLAAASGQAVRIDRPGGGFGGGPGGLPRGLGGGIDEVTNKVRGGLANAFQRASNAAQQLNLLVGVSIFGGLGALVAEGFRLNSQLEKVNLTMAATLGITNRVVDAQGNLVEGAERTNFLLRGTAGIYDQVRKIAAETILEQQELLETVAENLALGQQAGFKLETLGREETGPLVETIANISQLAKAVGLPGGQRQLSQEVRALFTGERLQGATIARLLGFTSIQQIQELQQQPGQQEGTTAFADELKKRFERVKPILDEFQNSAQGVFSTLISQGRLFLQVFSEAAFDEIVVAGRKLRDFLTDERIKATAKELGQSFGSLVRTLIDVGRNLAPLANLFGFMVRNASTIVTVLAAFKVLSTIQNLRGAGGIAGAGGLAAFLGGGGRIGSAVGGAGGAGGRVVGPIRGAAIEFASAAAGAGGMRAALARQGGLARGAFGSTLGRGGLGALAPAAGLFGLTPAVLLALSGGAGLGIGTGINALFDAGVGRGLRPPPAQVNEERAARVERITQLQGRLGRIQARERELRQQEVARRGAGADAFPLNVPAGTPTFVQRGLLGLLRDRPTPELTRRVTAEGLRQQREQIRERIKAARDEAKELQRLQLQRIEDANSTERLQAAQFLAQIRRNKEAEINLTAQLDTIAARNEIEDRQARNIKILAIEEDRQKKLRELREDERQETTESALAALGDETGVARARAERRRTEIARQFQGRDLTPELVRRRAQQEATANLVAQREILTARVGRLSQRAGFAGQLAGAEGRSLDEIRAQGFSAIAGVAQQVAEQRVTVQEFNRFVVAQNVRTQEEIRRKRRDVTNEGIGLVHQFTDAVRQSTDLQRQYELSVLQLKERVRDRERALNRARLSEINAVVDAQREAREAREDLAASAEGRTLRGRAFSLFREQEEVAGLVARDTDQDQGVGGAAFTGQRQSLEQQVQAALERRLRAEGSLRGLTRDQRTTLIGQRTREFLGGVADTLGGEGGVEGAAGQFGELGVRLTDRERQRLATLALTGAGNRQAAQERGLLREQVDQEGRVVTADQGLAEAREQRRRTEVEDFRARRDENRERAQIDRDFLANQARLALEFSNTADAAREFMREIQRAGIALSEGLTAVLVQATGVKVPSPEALAARDARRAVAADQAEAATTTVRPPTGRRSGETPPADGRRSEGNTIILNLPSIQLGADTKQTLETLTIQLERDSRRTPVS